MMRANNEFVIRYGTGASRGWREHGRTARQQHNLLPRVQDELERQCLYLRKHVAQPQPHRRRGHTHWRCVTDRFSFANPITHIFFRQAVLDADDILRADEIKIGTAWSDVVPSAGPAIPAGRGVNQSVQLHSGDRADRYRRQFDHRLCRCP